MITVNALKTKVSLQESIMGKGNPAIDESNNKYHRIYYVQALHILCTSTR